MIYKFRILSDEVEEFERIFEIPDTSTFFTFHLAIQKELEYDNSQIACFYLSNENWDKIQEFSLFKLTEDSARTIQSMEKSVLKNFISQKKERLIYIFDIFSERMLFMELIDILDNNVNINNATVCTYSKGDPPQQIVMDKIEIEEFEEEFDDDYDGFDPEFDSELDFDEAGFDDE
ncbi:MAG: hypothetical protein JXB49_20400 [Bacteroidales bacterium]|nr:hypothetical protein [Bacteroidales bacterium]